MSLNTQRETEVSIHKLPESKLFNAIIDQYQEVLFSGDSRGLDYLKSRGLHDVEGIKHFKVGFANGTLSKKLSLAQRKALQAGGLLTEEGEERFILRVVVPIFDGKDQPIGLYGRSIESEFKVKHLYFSGKPSGVWNGAAAEVYPDQLIVTDSILDGLSLFQAGQKNVIACYGETEPISCLEALLAKHSVKKLVFAFGNDERGQGEALKLAQALDPKGLVSHRIKWPEQIKDACDYFQYNRGTDFKGTEESFAALLAVAPRIGHKRLKNGTSTITLAERTEDGGLFQNGTVNYRVKGLTNSGLRVVVMARKDELAHIDNLDLYAARSRKAFAVAAAERLRVEAGKVEEDLLEVLALLEELQAEAPAPVKATGAASMSEEQKEEAMSLLRSPKLLERIAQDLEAVGYVGEDRNKRLAYLIATSRLLPKPLSGIFRAQSGCGKSFLMECVTELMPPEEVHYFSRLTPQALYYLEPEALKHKLLIVDERDGSEESEYPIRTLQTRRVLKLAVPIKDPSSGKTKTTVLEIHGPISYMESTTDQWINPENGNRCFELYLDESEAQTRAIFAAQKRSRTLDGWKIEQLKSKTQSVHHNAQRLLRSLKVIIPYVDLIEFPAAWLRGRRDNDRFLSLIEGVAFLHQHQRSIVEDNGVEHIEASVEDYAAAYDLAHQIFADSACQTPRPVREFLAQVGSVIETQAQSEKVSVHEVWFSRRMIREAIKLPDHLIKTYMRQIEDLEYVQVKKAAQGGSFRYRLLPQTQASTLLAGLTAPEILTEKWNKWVKSGNRPKSTSTR